MTTSSAAEGNSNQIVGSGEVVSEEYKREWEIRRRKEGEQEWHLFATFEPDTHWTEIRSALEFYREQWCRGVEYQAFEIMHRRIELNRNW